MGRTSLVKSGVVANLAGAQLFPGRPGAGARCAYSFGGSSFLSIPEWLPTTNEFTITLKVTPVDTGGVVRDVFSGGAGSKFLLRQTAGGEWELEYGDTTVTQRTINGGAVVGSSSNTLTITSGASGVTFNGQNNPALFEPADFANGISLIGRHNLPQANYVGVIQEVEFTDLNDGGNSRSYPLDDSRAAVRDTLHGDGSQDGVILNYDSSRWSCPAVVGSGGTFVAENLGGGAVGYLQGPGPQNQIDNIAQYSVTHFGGVAVPGGSYLLGVVVNGSPPQDQFDVMQVWESGKSGPDRRLELEASEALYANGVWLWYSTGFDFSPGRRYYLTFARM